MRCRYTGLLVLFLVSLLSSTIATAQAKHRSLEKDHLSLIALENEWLANEHNAASLQKIIAYDFVHPVVTGDLLTRSQHIRYSTEYRPPSGQKNHFDNLNVRIYGNTGIVNGIVVTTDSAGSTVNRTIFTDVFVYRGRRWQAVNAQENTIQKMPPPNRPQQ
jgi:hypothetical protein